jgi:hypothetical protein
MSLKYVKTISEPGSNLPDEEMTPEEAARGSGAESQSRSDQPEPAAGPKKPLPEEKDPPPSPRAGKNPLERDDPSAP